MTQRLCICILLLFMTTLISYQHPLPILNTDVSQVTHRSLQGSQYNGIEFTDHNTRFKRQVGHDTLEGQHHHQEKRRNEESYRKKRLESEDESLAEKNQFYRPVSDETKESISFFTVKQDKEGESDHRIADDLSGAAKLDVLNVVRPERQATSAWGDVRGMGLGNSRVRDQCSEPLNSNSDKLVQSLYSAKVGRKDSYKPQEQAGTHLFSAETLDTMKKINPLTIGDQVSQMIHDRKCNLKTKLIGKAPFDSRLGSLQNEDQVVDPSISLSCDNDDAVKPRPAYVKQQPPKIVQKPCPSNDYGFSVIILAGDPLKMVGSGARCENTSKEEKGSKKKNKGSGSGNDECVDEINASSKILNELKEQPSGEELRVPKYRNAHVEFPVYDQDLANVPDPFNGLLEKNYWVNPVNKAEKTFMLAGPNSYPDYSARVRRAQKANGNKDLSKNGNKNDAKNGTPVPNEEANNKNDNKNDVKNCTLVSNGEVNNGNKNKAKNGTPVSNGGDSYSKNGNNNSPNNGKPVPNGEADETTPANSEDAGRTSGDSRQPELEPFGDLDVNINKTYCISWREPSSNNNTAVM